MTLHLAGHYHESNKALEEADALIGDLYTRHLRNEVSALLLNDLQLPFRGEPYEQVMVNVVKALNYGVLGDFEEALVEARKIDHRLNVLTDSVDPEDYHEDPFARYLTGLLYETAGDLPNALIAYEKSYTAYTQASSWLGMTPPQVLRQDLLRVTKMLHLDQEHEAYRQAFQDLPAPQEMSGMARAQLVVISLNGRAPYLEDTFVDVPISMDALNLLATTKSLNSPRRSRKQALLYGIHGHIVRIGVPKLIPQKTKVRSSTVRMVSADSTREEQTQRVYNGAATAKKNLDDRYAGLVVKAVARAAGKMAAAEGIGIGAGAAVDKESKDLVRAIVSAIARIFVLASEESDKRSWRTLPDEIQVARFWLPAGPYMLQFQSVDRNGQPLGVQSQWPVTLEPGQVRLITKRVVF